MCLLMVVLEAYLLRVRHVIASVYYPLRENQRAAWLYSHILRRRGFLLQSTRREAKKNFKTFKEAEKTTLLQRLTARYEGGYLLNVDFY